MKLNRQENVQGLWDELAAFPASQIDTAATHLMTTLRGWLEADDVAWAGAARMAADAAARQDPLCGWRVLAVRRLLQTPLVRAKTGEAIRTQESDPGMTSMALAATAGNLRVFRLHDGFVDFEAFSRTPHYQAIYLERGISDRMFVGIPVNDDVELFFLVDRCRKETRFSPEEAALAETVMRGLKWFCRELMLSHGLSIAKTPLTPTERRIVHLMLTDCTEKEIAAAVGQAPGTTHKYITEILRKFGVRSRVGLMALWLERQG